MDKDVQRILILNCGSSSLKLTVFELEEKKFSRLYDVHLKEFKSNLPQLDINSKSDKDRRKLSKSLTVQEGLELIFDILITEYRIDVSSIRAIGHRFVHGGNHFRSSVRIDQEVIDKLEKLVMLAPLHNESCLLGIKESFSYFGNLIPQVAVFDTAFFTTMPQVAHSYALPLDLARSLEIKRYGFHGISYSFVCDTFYGSIGEKVIIAHLGNGCSMSAIREGIALDTSMGFTPLEGLVMGTRTGDIDPAVVEFLCMRLKKTASEVLDILNFESGLLGLSKISSNMEDLLDNGSENAKFAIELFCYRAIKYFGAYIAVLKGVDSIIFTGGIGENSPYIREKIIYGLDWLGVFLDKNINNQCKSPPLGSLQKISTRKSKVSVFVVTTDENQYIAKESFRLSRS